MIFGWSHCSTYGTLRLPPSVLTAFSVFLYSSDGFVWHFCAVSFLAVGSGRNSHQLCCAACQPLIQQCSCGFRHFKLFLTGHSDCNLGLCCFESSDQTFVQVIVSQRSQHNDYLILPSPSASLIWFSTGQYCSNVGSLLQCVSNIEAVHLFPDWVFSFCFRRTLRVWSCCRETYASVSVIHSFYFFQTNLVLQFWPSWPSYWISLSANRFLWYHFSRLNWVAFLLIW